MPGPVPKQQTQAKSTYHVDPVKQAEEESARECQEAYDLTDPKYHRFITLIRQNKRVGGSRQNPIFATIHKPYMRVDGRIQEAIDEATMAGRTIKVETDFDTVGEKKIVIKTVHTERGTASSIACINFGGKGVDETSPLENADTSAYGRALGQLGYGIIGGIASAEEVQQAIEQQDQPVSQQDEPRPEDRPPSKRQIAFLRDLLSGQGTNETEIETQIAALKTAHEASTLINDMRHRPMSEREVRRAEVQKDVDDDEREALINKIRKYIRPMTQELRVSFFNQFFGCKPAEISEMDTDAIKENWRKACEELVKE